MRKIILTEGQVRCLREVYNFDELRNIKRMLSSSDEANVSLGMELLDAAGYSLKGFIRDQFKGDVYLPDLFFEMLPEGVKLDLLVSGYKMSLGQMKGLDKDLMEKYILSYIRKGDKLPDSILMILSDDQKKMYAKLRVQGAIKKAVGGSFESLSNAFYGYFDGEEMEMFSDEQMGLLGEKGVIFDRGMMKFLASEHVDKLRAYIEGLIVGEHRVGSRILEYFSDEDFEDYIDMVGMLNEEELLVLYRGHDDVFGDYIGRRVKVSMERGDELRDDEYDYLVDYADEVGGEIVELVDAYNEQFER